MQTVGVRVPFLVLLIFPPWEVPCLSKTQHLRVSGYSRAFHGEMVCFLGFSQAAIKLKTAIAELGRSHCRFKIKENN